MPKAGLVKQIIYSKITKDYVIGKLTPSTKMASTKDRYFICAIEPFLFEFISPEILTNDEICSSVKGLKVEKEANPISLQFEISGF